MWGMGLSLAREGMPSGCWQGGGGLSGLLPNSAQGETLSVIP